MKTVVLYTDGGIESDRIRSLLQTLKGEYLEYTLGVDFTQVQFDGEFGEEATYPQVAIGTKHIGGLKETLQYFQRQSII